MFCVTWPVRFVIWVRRRREAVLNGAAVLEAVFLPASKAGQYPRIASSGEIVWEQGQLAVPRMAAVLPPLQDVDLRPCSFVITDPWLLAVTPSATLGVPRSAPVWSLVGRWGGLCSTAEHHPTVGVRQGVMWGHACDGEQWCGIYFQLCHKLTIFVFGANHSKSLSPVLPICKKGLSVLSSWEWSLNRSLLRKHCRGMVLDGCKTVSKYDWIRRSCRKKGFKKLNQGTIYFFLKLKKSSKSPMPGFSSWD